MCPLYCSNNSYNSSKSLRHSSFVAYVQQRFVTRFPPVLMFTVARDSALPLRLSNFLVITDYQQQKCSYLLFGIVCHSVGGPSDSGHYASYLFTDVSLPDEFKLEQLPVLPSALVRDSSVSSRPVASFDDMSVVTDTALPDDIEHTCVLLFYIRCKNG